MRVVVAGGTGFIGRRLCEAYVSEGHEVTVVTRRPTVQAGTRQVGWDAGLAGALDGADAVVNLAGEGVADARWTPGRKTALRESRLEAARRLVGALSGAKRTPSVFVNASAVGYYGDRGDEVLTEASAPGSDFLATLCRDWEAEAAKFRRPGTRLVVARFGIVIGKGGGALPRMALPFRLFAGGRLGSGRQYVPWIHLDDAVDLVRWAVDSGVDGPVNATAPEPVTNEEFSRRLAKALGRPCLFPVPAFALRLAVGEMAGMLLGGQRAVPAVASSRGFRFRRADLNEALRDLVA